VLPANWCGGLADAAAAGVFVSPPIDGWVLAVGSDLARRRDAEQSVLPLLQAASRGGGRAVWLRCDAAADEFGWALAEGGEIVRAYAYSGADGPELWIGEVTDVERELGCFVDDPRDRSDDDVKWWPDRRIVHALAAAWALDPDRLGDQPSRSAGVVGRL
jgi:hypothetical protein